MLRLRTIGQVFVAFLWALITASIAILVLASIGGFRTFPMLIGSALIAGIAGSIAYNYYVFTGNRLAPYVGGFPSNKGYMTGVLLSGLMLGLGMGVTTIGALIAFRDRTFAGPMLGGLQFPSVASLPVLGQADGTWRFQGLDGKEKSLSDYQGKVVFLNRWATWCGPCVAEMPNIARLKAAMAGMDVEFLLVSQESADIVRSFAKSKEMDPLFFTSPTVPEVFQTQGIPATFILDRKGAVVFSKVGMAEWDSPECQDFLTALTKK